MTPALRLAITLVLSLLMWLPMVPGALAAHEDPAAIALRYLLALVVSRVGVGVVFRVVNGYAAQIEDDEPPPAEPDIDSTPDEMLFGRRRDDLDIDDRTDEALLDEALEDVRETTSLVP